MLRMLYNIIHYLDDTLSFRPALAFRKFEGLILYHCRDEGETKADSL